MRIIKYTSIGMLLSFPVLFQNCARGGGFEVTDFSSMSFNSTFQSVGISCEDPSIVTPKDIRRLNRTEVSNTVKSVFGDSIFNSLQSALLSLMNDEVKIDPRTFQSSFDSWQLSTIDRLARQAGAQVIANDGNLKSIAGDCALSLTTPNDCLKTFITSFGKKMFRRPLTDSDVTFFTKVYSDAGFGRSGISAVVAGMVLSPEFLYHVEIGKPGVGSNTQFSLTDHEIASRISYLLTDGPPDAAMMAKADDGTLRLTSTLSAEVDRLLMTPAAREKLHRFISYWLQLDKFQGIPSAPNYLAGIDTNGLTAEMSRELYEFIDYIVFTKKGSYKDLLTSKASFARSPALASIYGHSPRSSTDAPGQMGPNHQGLFLRSPVLADGTNQTHPILRGVFVLRRMMCNEMPGPSQQDIAERMGTESSIDPLKDSTAIATAKKTSGASCMKCHGMINPVGFAFEGYDNLGRARTIDTIFDSSGNIIAKHNVSISSRIPIGSAIKSVTSATQLMDHMADSTVGPACMARHLFRFYNVQRESATDGCALTGSVGALQDPDGGILAGIKASILNAYTTQRRVQ